MCSSTNISQASFVSPVPGLCLISLILVQFTTLAFHCTSDHVPSDGDLNVSYNAQLLHLTH